MDREIAVGYKQTEVGVIPEDWKLKEFSEISFMKGRIGWQGLKQTEFTMNADDPFLITGMNFKDGDIRWNEVYHVSEDRYQIAKDIQLKVDDILMTKDGTIGKLLYVKDIPYPKKASLNSHLLVFRPTKQSYIPLYLYYNLHSPFFFNHIELHKSGTTFFGISQESVSKYKVILPSITEQTAIATALSDVDELISGLEHTLAKKRLLKQGAMQVLLTGKKRLAGFSGEWEEKTIDQMCIPSGLVRGPFGGALKKEFFVEKGFKVYEQKNAIYGDIELGNYFVDKNKFDELKRFKVLSGDFIVSCSGTIGKIYQIPEKYEEGIINQALLKITIDKDNYSEKYFCHFFKWDKFQNKIIDTIQGGAMKNLVGMPIFKSTNVNLPTTKEEQTAIAQILTDMDNEIEALEKRRTKILAIKQGMMQELLTGKTRLI